MENASGRTKSVMDSVKSSVKTIFTKPHHFFFSKPFALIYVCCSTRRGWVNRRGLGARIGMGYGQLEMWLGILMLTYHREDL